MATTDRLRMHSISNRDDHRRLCIPIGMHGDGVTVTGVGRSWSKGCDAFSWSNLLSTGESNISNFIIFVIFHNILCISPDKDTMGTIWRHLRWSFMSLWEGMWPTEDPIWAPDRRLQSRHIPRWRTLRSDLGLERRFGLFRKNIPAGISKQRDTLY